MIGLYGDVQHGRVISVRDEVLGDHLSVAAVATDTTIYLDDLSMFTENGGQALLTEDAADDELVTYTGFTAAEDGLVLSAGLAANHELGTSVQVYPQRTNRIAFVQVDDPDREPIPVRVPFSLKDRVPIGQRSDIVGEDDDTASPPEEALIHLEHHEWVLADVPRQDVSIDLGALDTTGGHRNFVETKTDFLGDVDNLQSGDFIGISSGTGAQIIVESVPISGHRGVWELQTGTTASGSSRVSTHNGTTSLGEGRIKVGCLLKPQSLSDGTDRYTIYFGLMDTGLESNILNAVYMRYRDNVNSGSWSARVINDPTVATNTLSEGGAITVAAAHWYLLEIEINAAGDQADFYINGALKGSLGQVAFPTSSDYLEVRVGIEKVSGTGNRGVDLDYAYYYEELSQPR